MVARAIGSGFAAARDAIARVLVRAGVSPNSVSVAGLAFTLAAGVCLALGARSRMGFSLTPHAPANAYLPLAAVLIVLSSACDMVDGAVARGAGRVTRFGAFLDSTLDRFSDFAVYAGIAVAYAWTSPANVTFILLSMIALCNAFMISYTRARAENLIASCSEGFWQRGERSAAILIAILACNIPALLLQQSILTMCTVLRRIAHVRAVLAGKTVTDAPHPKGQPAKRDLWRWPRLSVSYDIVVTLNIAWLIFARVEPTDWLRTIFA